MSEIQLCTWGSVGFGVGGLLSRYWCGPPRGSGGRTPLERMVGWARRAEDLGFDYLLIGQRWLAGVDGTPADGTLECFTNTAYMMGQTSRIHLISAIHPGLWLPAVMAKMGASLDQLGGGRWDINVISGWHRQEFEMFGGEWLEHDDRYARSEEFIDILKLAWTRPAFDYDGRFYQLRDVRVQPKPAQRPHPAIFQGGNSPAARRMAGRCSDWYFMNGGPPERILPQVREVSELAARHGRRVRFCLNGW
ncbi:MAG TPA: LLM class flavin-dependent oxidoreductase, partial [Dehalococcoidia bacterium]|nr:LLM class flavin-dependent oxidoreductase [Dehalococcoidia bacterium]